MAKELDIDKMLKDVDKGKGPSTAGQTKPYYKKYEKITVEPPSRQNQENNLNKFEDRYKSRWGAPVSNMPKGGKQSPAGDLSKLRQAESHKAFKNNFKKLGADVHASSCLPYRKPATAIDAKYGPGDKVC